MTMTEKLTTFDPAQHLSSPQAIAGFIDDAFESGGPAYIAHAFDIVAKAKGMTTVAKQNGLSREQLYRSFSKEGNPTLHSMLAVMKVFGIRMSAKHEMVD